MDSNETRPHISSTGSFVAVPDAFPLADASVRNAIKLEFRTVFSAESRIQTIFSTDKVLIDIGAVTAAALDTRKIAKDCDFVKDIVLKYPDEIKDLILALQSGGTENIEKAETLAEKIGLNEEAATKAGGGLFWLLIPVIIGVAAGGCGTLNSNKPFKQPTTPKPAPQ